jgi:hypothetical protein
MARILHENEIVTAVENGGAERSKLVTLRGIDLP